MNTAIRICLVCVLLVVSIGLMVDSLRGDAANVDEFDHLVSGYAFLRQIDLHGLFTDPVGTFIEQPPLIKAIAAIPLLFMQIQLPQKSPTEAPPLTYNYFYNSKNDPDRLLFWSRMPMLLLFVLLALLIEKWARELYGPTAGLFALFLAVFNTTLMASGRYVMTDLGVSLFYALSIYTFLRCLERPSVMHMLGAGITFGLAQVAKFSALVLFPTFLAIAVCSIFRSPEKEGVAAQRRQHVVSVLKILVVVWLIGGVVIASVYSYQTWNVSKDSQTELAQELLRHPRTFWLAKVVNNITAVSKPLGYYALGLAVLSVHNARGHRSYLFGHIAKSQGWRYFPIAFTLKTQLPLIVLICLTCRMVNKDTSAFSGWTLLLPALIYALVALSTRINYGVRHLLPLYPLLIVWASKAVHWPIRMSVMNVAKTAIITGLACWYVFGALSVHPHYLAYFNELAGGSANGYRYLSDSNIDIGQDIKRLGVYLGKAGITDVKVLCSLKSNLWGCNGVTYYIPHAQPWDPQASQSSPEDNPTGFFVVGKTTRWHTGEFLKGNPRALSQWQAVEKRLEDIEPLHTIGYSIDLYYLSPHGSS
jgi:hypothetical protein